MAFGTFKVHTGDFKKGDHHQFLANQFIMKIEGQFFREKIDASQIEELEIATEENVKRLSGTVGWGIVGGVLLGPVGLLAGLLAGGRGKDITFICRFKDGRKFLATAPAKVYTQISASIFK